MSNYPHKAPCRCGACKAVAESMREAGVKMMKTQHVMRMRYDIDYVDGAGNPQTTAVIAWNDDVKVAEGLIQFATTDGLLVLGIARIVMISAEKWEDGA